MMVASVFTGCSQKENKSGEDTPAVTDAAPGTESGDKTIPGEYVGFDGIDPDTKAEVTIYRYYADADKVNMDAAIEKLSEKYPNLKINIEHRTDSDGTALKTWAAVGELPDIFENTSAEAYNSLKENGDLYCLDDAIKATGFYDLFTNGEVSQKSHTNADGHQYSMACEVNHVFELWYNRELFDGLGLQEPANYEEFKNCITVLKDAGKVPIALFGAEQWPGTALYSLACIAEGQAEGVEAVNDGKASISDDAYVRAAQKFAEIVDLGAFGTGALSTNYQQASEMMFNGQAGFFASGTWFWSTIEGDGYGDIIDWCNSNVFADADKAEDVKGMCVGGKIKEMQYSVNANPPSGLDPYTVALLLCEFEYYVRLNAAEAGNMTTVKGDFNFTGSKAYADFNDSYGGFKTFTTLTGDMSNGDFVEKLGNNVEMMVSDNYGGDEFINEMIANGY
jgi:raffinose/stachyose/melibiose transport system substrate-binding protein